MAATSSASWTAGFHVSRAARLHFCSWMFLARLPALPQTVKHAAEVLGEEDRD